MPTKIEWCEETWNPVTGCSKVSEGCRNCYAARLASGRLRNHPHYQGLAVNGNWTGEVLLHHDMLEAPLHWRKPRMCFVCSMSDLFHESVHRDYILRVWKTMAGASQHTFQVLTKRPGRMRETLTYWMQPALTLSLVSHEWPLRNVWLGTTVENQKNDWRIPYLLKTLAAVKFVSLEPLLGPIDFEHNLGEERSVDCGGCDASPVRGQPYCPGHDGGGIDWVIVGAETGPGARYMDPDWARDIRDQCKAADVPFFMKSVSNNEPIPDDLMIREYPGGGR